MYVITNVSQIEDNVKSILDTIPKDITFIAAAKNRSLDEVRAVIDAGINILGYNYIQEAEQKYNEIGNSVKWHLIGHLQRNKVKKAIRIFDMIETIDSVRIAREVNKGCESERKIMPVLIEINSGKESNKTGVFPEELDEFIEQIRNLSHLKIQGLMTMGPRFGVPEDSRPYFQLTKSAFDKLKSKNIPNVEMKFLSMGMSNSYKIAIEEGANIIRIGTKIFE